MAKNKNSFIEVKVINTLDLWKEFKEQNPKYKDVPTRELKNNIKIFFDRAGDLIADKKDGIILNMLGYFGNAAYKKNTFPIPYNEQTSKIDNILTQGYSYRSMFYPTVFKNSPLRQWLFQITRHKARRMATRIIDDGIRYKCHFTFLKNIVKDHKYLFTDNE